MPLGIKPIVDFAFKKVFGSTENAQALIGLLNAILGYESPIEHVDILNPFNYQEFQTDKQIVLDVRARDQLGRWFNIEMQVSVVTGLEQRLVYYASSLYLDQLEVGDHYAKLCPAVSICILASNVFTDSSQPHHCFSLVDQTSGRRLENGIEVHTVELAKYNLGAKTIATDDVANQWVFLLLYAQEHSAAELRSLLPKIEFETAIAALQTISEKTEDKTMYDQRLKAQRDHEWLIAGAKAEGIEEGLEQGLEQGLKQGATTGLLAGKIQVLQELLGDTVATKETLLEMSPQELEHTVTALQDRMRNRRI